MIAPLAQFMVPIQTRQLTLRATATTGRTIPVVLATETPVPTTDAYGRVMDEVLVMSGATFPDSRQVPFLNAHVRSEVLRQIGSIRNLVVAGKELHGVAHFATHKSAEGVYQLAKEGHLTDISVGYRIDDEVVVAAGKTWEHEGQTYVGPVRVVTAWTVKEGSAVPIGADPNAKIGEARELVWGSTSRQMIGDDEEETDEADSIDEATVVRMFDDYFEREAARDREGMRAVLAALPRSASHY